MNEFIGWLLDLYDDPNGGVCLWLVGDDGQRRMFRQRFPVTFYVKGEAARLRAACAWLEKRSGLLRLGQAVRRDLFEHRPETLLAVEVQHPHDQFALFRDLESEFPDLTYYDVDVPLTIRHGSRYGTFPLAKCCVQASPDGWVEDIEALDTPWDTDPEPPPLRVMELEPDVNPDHAPPSALIVRCDGRSSRLSLQPARPMLINLRVALTRLDPDVILTDWGDTWLLPYLQELANEWHVDLPFNRDEQRRAVFRPERSYFSYGRVVFRGQQVHLFGRLHIDRRNAMLWKDYELPGVLESARVTCLPVQGAARLSPGTGISAMQMVVALRNQILVPWHKQQVEPDRSALDLLRGDRGGMVYQPTIGVHANVAEIDFVSMYPSIMVCANISPETRPGKNLQESLDPPGLVPQTLSPLLMKRVLLKQRMSRLPSWDPRRRLDRARISAHKWLLVTCFGYLGYKNARFGQITSHEAVTDTGREALLRAKETAEDLGFDLLHMYVDGLWIAKPGASQPDDFEELLERILDRTGLPIVLDGVYKWVCFLPSRMDERVPVGNRYFGVFQSGEIKVRGIEARRRDTPAFIAHVQMELIEHLAQLDWPGDEGAQELAWGAVRIFRCRLDDLRRFRVPLEDLLVAQRLSRELEAYRTPSPGALAAMQLAKMGKTLSPGQKVRFLYTLGSPGVHAWDLPEPPPINAINVRQYEELLIRAADTVLKPFGVDENMLRSLAGSIPAVQEPLRFARKNETLTCQDEWNDP